MRWVFLGIVVAVVLGVGYGVVPDTLRYLRLRNM
ncbi:DUF6893 family small protein [Kribbella qitaiheensis]